MALWFPRLPTDRVRRHRSNLSHASPLVVAEKLHNALRLSAVDKAASQLGLHVGQPLANARAMVPELTVIAANEKADLKLLESIADWLDRCTPLVALDGARHVMLDVAGVSHLFGGEQAMLTDICNNLSGKGLTVRGAVAGTAAAARALARYRHGSVITSGNEVDAVKPLPVEALDLDTVATHALRRAGLKSVGQVAGRKRSELMARLGASALAVLDEILGLRGQPITPRKPAPDYWQEQSFAEPVATGEVIQEAIHTLALRLAEILERHGQGARRLEAVFFRADGAVRSIAIETGTPAREPGMIERLFREKLSALSDELDPGFGFDLIRLCASRIEALQDKAIDLAGATRAQGEIGFLIDRLSARFGSGSLTAFQPVETHVPERAWKAVPAQQAQPSKLSWVRIRNESHAPQRPLRMFARSEALLYADERQLLWRKATRSARQWLGPERIALQWWRQEQAGRDYYCVEDEAGRRYWLYRDLSATQPQWFLHGLFA